MLAHVTAAALAATLAAQSPPPTEPCPELQPAMRCGQVDVPLDHRRPGGAKLPIGFAVLRHTDESRPALDPVFIVLGGPGDASTGDTGPGTRNFAAVRDRRDTVWVDLRGTGRSDPIDCSPFQHLETDVMEDVIDAVGACGAQLGADSDRYGAADVADDIDDVRAALGYRAINLYAVSYGTVHAQAYALRHRAHLRALILNGAMSPLDHRNDWMTGESNADAVARNVALVCRRSPGCSRANPHPAATFAWLADRLRRRPVGGVDEAKLVRIALTNDPLYTNAGELVAAAAALRRGDEAPLLRLSASANRILNPDWGDPAEHSGGDNAAAQCTDFNTLWDVGAPLARRQAQYERAIARLSFGPFSPHAWADNGGFSGYCLKWPAPDDQIPVFTRGTRLPDVPAIVISATTDTSTTLEQGAFVARALPRSAFIVMRNGGHPPAASARCMPEIYTRFLTTLDAGDTSCVYDGDADRPAIGTFYRRAGDGARPHRRRVARIVSATVQDALRQAFARLDENGEGRGLRGGTFRDAFDEGSGVETLTLHGARFSEDVAVGGQVEIADGGALAGRLTVDAPRAGGEVQLSGRWWTGDAAAGPIRVDGTLGGRAITVVTPGG